MKACICTDIVWDPDDDLDNATIAGVLLDLPTTVAVILDDDFDIEDTETLADVLAEQFGIAVDSFVIADTLPAAFE